MHKFVVLTVAAFVAAASAGLGEYKSSSYSFSSAAAPAVYSAPIAPVVAKYAVAPAPVYVHQAEQYSPVAPVAKVAVPVVSKYVAAAPSYAHQEEEYGPAQYEFAYSVQDAHTGDYHSQEEKRDGHHVVGQYALHQPDGTLRIVKYFDEGHGFNAAVEIQGHPTEAPAKYAAPVGQYH
ncbi:hypothetical protein GWI33_004816 [Rhynchophorus ferrugineus]|uniref:Cuticle protein n=1 Tax=Rhynchophorus ferrugineus TaxID=354439 RepID=A0A834IHR1_RHYFE|nr:hypothetical protein GWI33_004816 [Rhynchophorus ferrugineus]